MSDCADEQQRNLYKKFPTTHFLSNPNNVDHVLLWNTFFRRNLHRVATDYLGLKLHFYQIIILYLLGICKVFVEIACRAAAKSYILAIYAVCKAIVYPYSRIVIASATQKQAKLIVTEKIQNELYDRSPMLRREIESIKDNQDKTIVTFRNGSIIKIVAAGETGRGNRSDTLIREEFRQIPKNIEDSILAPFQVFREPPYSTLPEYADLIEDSNKSVDIYISSSWIDNGHWMWGIVDSAYKDMLDGKNSYLLAFDESITLKHKIKSREQLLQNKRTMDPLTFMEEIKNYRIKENAAAFFTYTLLMQNQLLKKPFYPRNNADVRVKKKGNIYGISKQKDEIRVIACDMAFVDRKGNDNSVFTCIRALPENTTYRTSERTIEIKQGYRRIVPYMEARPGGDIDEQAIRIRQLYEDFDADYIVLDVRSGGIAVYHKLAKTMYDESRDCEYSPLTCMNDETLANSIKIDGALPVIYAINASAKLNSDIATTFRVTLKDKMIEFLVPLNVAQNEILPNYAGYNTDDIDVQLDFERPFIETQLMVSETTSLVYEKKEQTGTIVISEQGNNTKDRYTSVSYGDYFISLLEKDLLSEAEEHIDTSYSCVSSVDL